MPQLAVANEPQRRAGLDEPHVDVAGGDVGDRLRRVAVGHVRELEAEALLHEFHGQMLRDARAG